jgi:L-lysine 2,3-aminomutase
MIHILKNTVNDCVFTLRENSSLWNISGITPYYLFQFTSENTNQSIYFTATDITPQSSITRYDEFYIIETGSTYQNLTAGTINLNPGGYYTYQIYEQVNPYNLSVANTQSMVEKGIVQVSGETGYSPTFYTQSGSSKFVTYTASQIP